MEAPQRVKDVQHLNGCITARRHFISRLGERALPFFKLLKKSGPVEWNPEAEEALQSLKSYLASPPVLVAPMEKEPLLLYIAATNQLVSAVLVAEHDASPKKSSKGKHPGDLFPGQSSRSGVQGFEDPSTLPPPVNNEPRVEDEETHSKAAQPGATPTTPRNAKDVEDVEPAKGPTARKVQHPVYFVSSVLRDARERYPMMQKLLLAILIASRKMRPYFEGHPITVVSK